MHITYPLDWSISFKLSFDPVFGCFIILYKELKNIRGRRHSHKDNIKCTTHTSLATKSVLYGSPVAFGSLDGSSARKYNEIFSVFNAH